MNTYVENASLNDGVVVTGLLLELANGEATRAATMTALDNLGERGELVQLVRNAAIPNAAAFFAETGVAFFGCSGVDDATINAYLGGLGWPGVIKAGFAANPATLAGLEIAPWPAFINRLKSAEAIVLAGHSYGGVVCDALDLQLLQVRARPRTMITYGSPRAVPVPSFEDRTFTRRVHVRNLRDAVPFFPPSGDESPAISLLIAQLFGQWPADFCRIGELYLQDGLRPWVRPDPGVSGLAMQFNLANFGINGFLGRDNADHALRNYLPPAVTRASKDDALFMVQDLPVSDPYIRPQMPSEQFRQFVTEQGFSLPRFGGC